ncbi:MAG: RNA polymerase sigma factor [Planctomycetes bacterium]|nr:RNA polymerase sigma factor [Planctomycetota bacterium]
MTTTNARSDQELLEHFMRGDEVAFTELVMRHQEWVRTICLRRLGAAEADDACQAVFIILSRKASGLLMHTCLAAWLHRTAAHVVNNAVRRLATRRSAETALAAVVTETAPPATGYPEVTEAIEALPEPQRQVVMLHYFLGHDHAAIASELGCPINTVYTRLHRAVKRLRQRLALPAEASIGLILVPGGLSPGAHAGTAVLPSSAAASPAALELATVTMRKILMAKILAVASGVAIAATSVALVLVATHGSETLDPPAHRAIPILPPAVAAAPASVAHVPVGPHAAAEALELFGYQRMTAVTVLRRLLASGRVRRDVVQSREAAILDAIDLIMREHAIDTLTKHLSSDQLVSLLGFLSTPDGKRFAEHLRVAVLEEVTFINAHDAAVWAACQQVLAGEDPARLRPFSPSEVGAVDGLLSADLARPSGDPALRRPLAQAYVEISGRDRHFARMWISALIKRVPPPTAEAIVQKRSQLEAGLALLTHEVFVTAMADHMEEQTLRSATAYFASDDGRQALAAFYRFDADMSAWIDAQYQELVNAVLQAAKPPAAPVPEF